LSDLRETIKTIVRKRNENTIYYSPAFHTDCLPDLCPATSNCFSFDTTPDNDTKSFIIDWIYNIYKQPASVAPASVAPASVSPASVSPASVSPSYDDFCKKLTIGLFCVLDISTSGNNPPPLPYIDINDIKEKWDVMKVTNYSLATEQIQLDYDKIKEYVSTLSTFVSQTYSNNQSLLEFIQDFITKFTNSTTVPFTYSNDFGISKDYNTAIELFISQINTHNSVTAVGTLEYLDSLSKLYTTNTLCEGGQYNDVNVSIVSQRF
jgi:hypothetical protein